MSITFNDKNQPTPFWQPTPEQPNDPGVLVTLEDNYPQEDVSGSIFPENFKIEYAKWSVTQRVIWSYKRFKCRWDHLYLGRILEMDFQEHPHTALFKNFLQKQPEPGRLPKIALSDLDTTTKKRMILWSRGTFKTSSVIVEITQVILNYPNVRICFLTGGDQLAKRQLARAKRIFERPNEKFKNLFPEFCGIQCVFSKKENKWVEKSIKLGTAHEFTVPCRTNDTFAEPTFAISTAKSVKAGSHFDLIFIDDLVNDQNYRSVKLLEKCYEDYLDICPLLEPTGFIVMTGTRYSYGDTYERIQEMAKEEEKQMGYSIWKFSIRDCWSHRCRHCLHSDVYHNRDINLLEPPCSLCKCSGFESEGVRDVLFPAVRTKDGRAIGHTLEFLDGERIRLGAEFFANQYENNPIAQGSQTFTDVLIAQQTIHDINLIPTFSESYTFIVADLAYVGQEDKDQSVMLVCRLNRGRIFVVDCLHGNWDSGAVGENMSIAILKHRPNIIYPEKFNGWEAYDKIITSHAEAKGIQKVPIMWLKGSQARNAKLTRIGSVKGVLTNKRLFLFSGMPGYDVLVQQLKKWPKLGKHDDFADALGQVVAAPTGYQLEMPPAPQSTINWLRKLHQTQEVEENYYDNGGGTGLCM